MNRLSSVALSAALVIAGVGASLSAEARPYAGVAAGYPGRGVIEPVGYSRHYYGHDRYRHHEYGRDRHDRFHRGRWDRR